jgi:hypothetical protein
MEANMLDHEFPVLLLIIVVFLTVHLLNKLNSVEKKLNQLLSGPPTEDPHEEIDQDVQALIAAGKINKAIALYVKRTKMPLIDAERTIKRLANR